jgi:hypothetical protein
MLSHLTFAILAASSGSPPLLVGHSSPAEFAAGVTDCWTAINGSTVDRSELGRRGWQELRFVDKNGKPAVGRDPTFTRKTAAASTPTTLPTIVIDLPAFGDQPDKTCRVVGLFKSEDEIQTAKRLVAEQLRSADSTLAHLTQDRGNQTVDEFNAADRHGNLFRFKSLMQLHFLVGYGPAETK